MRALVAATLLLGGCLSEHERTLASWNGVYEVTDSSQNPTGCDQEGTGSGIEAGWFELDTEPGTEADLAEFRSCSATNDCEPVGFLTFLTSKVTDKRLEGAHDEVFFTAVSNEGGLCQVVHESVVASRTDDRFRVEISSGAATDVVAANADVCADLLELLASDPQGCDALRVIEGKRAR